MSSLKDVSLKDVGLKDVSLKDVVVPELQLFDWRKYVVNIYVAIQSNSKQILLLH